MTAQTERTGRCLCGAVTVSLSGVSENLGTCHCEMCRRWAGGPFMAVNADAVTIDDSDGMVGTYVSSDWAERGFCRSCGSVLFWRLTIPGPAQGETHLSAGLLDDWSGLTLGQEVYFDAKPAAYAFTGETDKMTEADIMAKVAATPTPVSEA